MTRGDAHGVGNYFFGENSNVLIVECRLCNFVKVLIEMRTRSDTNFECKVK